MVTLRVRTPAEERLSFYESVFMIYQAKADNVIYVRSSKNIERQRDIPGLSPVVQRVFALSQLTVELI